MAYAHFVFMKRERASNLNIRKKIRSVSLTLLYNAILISTFLTILKGKKSLYKQSSFNLNKAPPTCISTTTLSWKHALYWILCALLGYETHHVSSHMTAFSQIRMLIFNSIQHKPNVMFSIIFVTSQKLHPFHNHEICDCPVFLK